MGGERSYKLARRGALSSLPAARTVQVDAASVVSWRAPVLSILVQVRSGVYIRSLARDLGEAVACPAHLCGLVRTRVGPFRISEAQDPESLRAAAECDGWQGLLWETDIADLEAAAILVSEERVDDLAHGRSWATASSDAVRTRVYEEGGVLLGFARRDPERGWQPTLALSTSFIRAAEHRLE